MRTNRSEYPNLERYLHSTRIADNIRAAKRPEEWFRWMVYPALFIAWRAQSFLAIFAVCAVSMAGQMLFAAIRLRARSIQDLMFLGLRDKLPATVRRLFRQRQLAECIGEHQMDLLDRCGKHAWVVMAAAAELKLVGPKLPKIYVLTRNASTELADSAFRRAIGTMRRAIMSRHPLDPDDIAELERIELEMWELATVAHAFTKSVMRHDEGISLEPIIERLRAMGEFEKNALAEVHERA